MRHVSRPGRKRHDSGTTSGGSGRSGAKRWCVVLESEQRKLARGHAGIQLSAGTAALANRPSLEGAKNLRVDRAVFRKFLSIFHVDRFNICREEQPASGAW